MSTRDEWAGDLGRRWAAGADRQDALLGRFEDAARAALAGALGDGGLAGRRVLDLGCGPGASTLALARDGAQVTGLDISPDLIAVASARAAAAGLANARFVEADAAEARFDAPFEALFSRFGAMFFDDPVPAWRNLRAAVAPGAPLVVAAWRGVKENPWVLEPMKAVGDLLPPVERPPPGAPGPFGWGDPALPGAWLAEAGWRDVAFTPAEAPMDLSPGTEGTAGERAADFAFGLGPLSRRLDDLDDAARAEARERLVAALGALAGPEGLSLPGRIWIVTARA